MARSPRVPKYRKHSSGQARVTLVGKDHLLGPYNSAASHETYRRLVAEWLENRGKPAERKGDEAAPLTVSELILAYWKFAEAYYGFDGNDRGDAYCLRDALRVVKDLYGRTAAKDFGPLALKACRRHMVEKAWSRTYTNAQVDRVRRMYRWPAEEELLPGGVHEDLMKVTRLRAGKSEARETSKVRPVPQEHIDAAPPFMPAVVHAMVRFQLLTGCRPDEVCRLRPIDIDRSNAACWVYRPGSDQGPHGQHKTAHHGHERLVLIGPKAQAALEPFLGVEPDAYCFCPAEAERRRNAGRRSNRRTPLWPSHQRRRAGRRSRRRAPGDRYDTHSYRRAIARACAHADRKAHEDNPELAPEQVLVPAWSPNRLRHNRATELRPHGLDVAKTVLGHSKVETTQIYAEKDVQAAMDLIARIG